MPSFNINLKPRPYEYVPSWIPVLYGQHDGRGNYYYQAECTFCGLRSAGINSELATFQHYVHCSRRHGYVFNEDYPLKIVPNDEALQDTITKSMLYDLPLPGYAIHDNCIKQQVEGRVVCVLHDMQGRHALRGRVYWLGYI